MAKQYRHTATVQGSGHFPIDMLRYDRCMPADEQASADISRDDRRKVELVKTADHRFATYTERRWASFGWTVVNVEVEAI